MRAVHSNVYILQLISVGFIRNTMGIDHGSGGLMRTLERRNLLGCANHGKDGSCSICLRDEQTIRVDPDAPNVDASCRATIKTASVVLVCMEGWLKKFIGADDNMMFSPKKGKIAASNAITMISNALSAIIQSDGDLLMFFDMRDPEYIHGARKEVAKTRNKKAPPKVEIDIPEDTDDPITDGDMINVYAHEFGAYKHRKRFREYLFDRLARSISTSRHPSRAFVMFGSYGETAYAGCGEEFRKVCDPLVDIEADTRITRFVEFYRDKLPRTSQPIVVIMNDNDVMALTLLKMRGPDVYVNFCAYKRPMINLSLAAQRTIKSGCDQWAPVSLDYLYLESDYSFGFTTRNSLLKRKKDTHVTKRYSIECNSPVSVEDDTITIHLLTLSKQVIPIIETHGVDMIYEILHRYIFTVLYFLCYNPSSTAWGWSKVGEYSNPCILPRGMISPFFNKDMKLVARKPDYNKHCTFSIVT